MKQNKNIEVCFQNFRYFCWVITLMFLVYFLMIESDGELV
ncbi:putative membrane protein [Streptococcus pneumoniae 2070335]|nr:putative membrane protein [Streptococcus pneumoniae 2070335]